VDTSKENIKMCDCPEIQDAISKDTIDWRKQGYCKKHSCILTEDFDGCPQCPEMHRLCERNDYADHRSVWEQEMCEYDHWMVLPRQDQLQEMLSKEFTPWGKATMLRVWVEKQGGVITGKFIGDLSMEQLWLAFVMWELHQKKWDNGEWC